MADRGSYKTEIYIREQVQGGMKSSVNSMIFP